MIKIRVLYGTDFYLSRDRVQQVQDLFRQCFPDLADYADRIPALLRDPVRFGFTSALVVAEGALGRIDAFALLIHFEEARSSFLDFIATRSGLRGSGLGGALYEAVREFSLAQGSRGLYMEVEPDDPVLTPDPAKLGDARKRIRFYEQYGVRVVENPAYSRPLGTPATTAYLLFDGLDRTAPLGREEARKAVELILTRRFGHVVDPAYLRQVLDDFAADPVPLRPLQYVRRRIEVAPTVRGVLHRPFLAVPCPGHEIHHVRERGYFERPIRVETIHKALTESGRFDLLSPRHYPEKHILAVHDPPFVHYLQTVCAKLKEGRPVYPDTFPVRKKDNRPKELAVQAGYYCIDTGTPLYAGAYRAARSAVDAVLTASDEILAGRKLVYAVCRPPGHHAGRRFFGGFCYFNNAAIAAHYLSEEARVACLDIDYHHGNGTQDIFYERSDVCTLSIHGHPDYAYPYFSGYEDETGAGPGLGFNRNLPLPLRADDKRYLSAFDRALADVSRFRPDILVVCIGFDILRGDPTGAFTLTPGLMTTLGRRLAALDYPLLVVQEGGYNVRNIRAGCTAFFRGCGER